MNYYNEIKNELINNEVYKKVKDYSKNRSDLKTYFNVGKMLFEAGKHYGEGVIKEYSLKLSEEIGKKYNERTLRRMRQFYIFMNNTKWSPLATKLTWSHFIELLSIKDINKIEYYIQLSIEQNLSKRELRSKIKNNEYERLDEKNKLKLINKENLNVNDFVKNPIVIKNTNNYEIINEKILKQLILEDLESFMNELGSGFSFIGSEYKIKIGDSYNYIDLLFYNIKYKCYVVVELKVTELKKEYIGQIQIYMNYIDINIKTLEENKTIGIIIVKKDNKFILEYSSDNRIYETKYTIK